MFLAVGDCLIVAPDIDFIPLSTSERNQSEVVIGKLADSIFLKAARAQAVVTLRPTIDQIEIAPLPRDFM